MARQSYAFREGLSVPAAGLDSRGVNLGNVAITQRRKGWLRGKNSRIIVDEIRSRYCVDVPGRRPSV